MKKKFNSTFIVCGLLSCFLGNLAFAQNLLYGAIARFDGVARVNLATGELNLVGFAGLTDEDGGALPGSPVGLASDLENGIIWSIYNLSNELYTVDANTGAFTSALTLDYSALADVTGLENVNSLRNVGMAFVPESGLLYISDETSDYLYSLDPEVGELTPVGPIPQNISGLAYDIANGILYGVSGNLDQLFTLDLMTGVATAVGEGLGFDANNSGLAYDGETETLYLTELTQEILYTVSPTTGVATAVNSLSLDIDPTETNFNVVGLTFFPQSQLSAPTTITVNSVARQGTSVAIGFDGVDGGSYLLRKSLDLDFSSAEDSASVTLEGVESGVLEDANATEEKVFYRIEQIQE